MNIAVKDNQHGRIIAEAAKKHLRPLGCQRKGQSRFWFSDQHFWLIGIEFQPSAWSKGTYLNVGGEWMWDPKPYFSFDTALTGHIGRLSSFVPFKDKEQFEFEADRLAARAAEAVQDLRRRYSSLSAIAQDLMAATEKNIGIAIYHAAIAVGLAGDLGASRHLLDRLTAEFTSVSVQNTLRVDALYLASLLRDTGAFRSVIEQRVAQARELKKLKLESNCFHNY